MTNELEVEGVPSVPAEFALGTPYPNPFNDRFQLEFSLPESGLTACALRDLNGGVVFQEKRLLSAGTHRMAVAPGNLPSGIYLFELRSSSGRELVKVAHLK